MKSPSVLLPREARQPANPNTSATATPPSTSSSGSMRLRLRTIASNSRYSDWNASSARRVSAASSR